MSKKSIKKMSVIIVAVIMMLSMSMTAFASYISPGSTPITTRAATGSYTLDGRYMAYEYNITNSNSPHITIETYVDNVRIDIRNVSGSGKADWIDMKSVKNHSVYFVFSTASSGQSANVSLNAYSWQ